MEHRFVAGVDLPTGVSGGPAWWFAFRGADLLVLETDASGAEVPLLSDLEELALTPTRVNFLGTLNGRPVFAAEVPDSAEVAAGLAFRGLRGLFGALDDRRYALAGRAAQIVEWDRTHQFCGRCGTPTEYAPGERAKRCPRCGLTSFPRLSPAVITVVERGEEVLLARGPHFPRGMYALISGFVDPGESLEEAVVREIDEEIGIEVEAVRYFGSQPWPFPHQLMVGFTARYTAGEIALDGKEIEDARWFSVHDLPTVPHRLSIARRLIDAYAARHGVVIDQP